MLSVVIPVYKAEDCLHELHRRLTAALSRLEEYEIILVEDSGPDRSWDVIKAIATQDPHVTGYKLSRNFGQHSAVTAGLEQASGNWVVVMDCDLQDAPENIPLLLEKALTGYGIVFTQSKKQNDLPLKHFFQKFFIPSSRSLPAIKLINTYGRKRYFQKTLHAGCCPCRNRQERCFRCYIGWGVALFPLRWFLPSVSPGKIHTLFSSCFDWPLTMLPPFQADRCIFQSQSEEFARAALFYTACVCLPPPCSLV